MAAVSCAVSGLNYSFDIFRVGISLANPTVYSSGMRNFKEVFVIMPNNKTNQENKPGQSGSQSGGQGGMQGGSFEGGSQTGKQGTGQSGSQGGMNEPEHKGQFDKTGSSGGQFGTQNKENE